MVRRAAVYRRSSAISHLAGEDDSGMLGMEWWRREAPVDWDQVLNAEEPQFVLAWRECTYTERPFGNEKLVVNSD